MTNEEKTELDLERSAEFMDLVTPNQSRLFGYIYALVQNANDAHDLYQQTVLVLWRKYDTYKSGTNFLAWAMRTAKLEYLMYQRTRSRSRVKFSETLISQLAEAQETPPEFNIAEARSKALALCMDKLTDSDHHLVEQCYRRGVQIQQVASKLGRSSQSVCNSLRRVRTALLNCVDNTLAQSGEA